MRKRVMVVLVSVASLGASLAGGAPPKPAELVDKYSATLSNFDSMIVKTDISGKTNSFTLKEKDAESHATSELRVDGTRTSVRTKRWGRINNELKLTPDQAQYQSRLWNTQEFYQYDRSSTTSVQPHGRVFITRDKATIQKRQDQASTARLYPSAPLFGRVQDDTQRLDAILRSATSISVRENMEKVGDSDTYVVEATGPSGKYTVWLDPEHGHQVAKLQVSRSAGDQVFDDHYALQQQETIVQSIDNVRFEKVGDTWVPVEADVSYRRQFADGRVYENTFHHKQNGIVVNPDHDALRSFVPDDIEDGAVVKFVELGGLGHVWKGGQVTPTVDKPLIDSIVGQITQEKAAGSKAAGSVDNADIPVQQSSVIPQKTDVLAQDVGAMRHKAHLADSWWVVGVMVAVLGLAAVAYRKVARG